MGIRELPGDKCRGVDGTTMGSVNRSGGRTGGVLGPVGESGEPNKVGVTWPTAGLRDSCWWRGGVLGPG